MFTAIERSTPELFAAGDRKGGFEPPTIRKSRDAMLLLTVKPIKPHDMSAEDIIFDFPKVELHAHLNGCIRNSTLFELAAERNVQLSTHHFSSQVQANDKHMYNIMPRSLTDCFEMFAEIPKCVNDLDALARITREALEDFANDKVAYLELRTTPKRLLKSFRDANPLELEKKDYVECILKVIKTFVKEDEERYHRETKDPPNDTYVRLPLKCCLILAVDRSLSITEGRENVELAITSAKTNGLVVGVDFGGNPTKNDFRNFWSIFEDARKAGLYITLHCAEVDCGDDSSDISADQKRALEEAKAMLEFRPDRLGHALLLPPSLEQKLLDLKIPVETCPTSNVMTLELAKRAEGDLVHGLQQHPALQQWLDNDHPLAVSTDDPGVFDTSQGKELILLHRSLDVSPTKISSTIRNAMKYAFCDEILKGQVQRAIEREIEQILSTSTL